MKQGISSGVWLVCGLMLFSGFTWGPKPKLGNLKSADYPMTQISNHTPWNAKSTEKYWNSLQRIELEIGKQDRFRDLPALGMKNPYTGYITLGDRDQKFGFIVDIFGEEKRLYIDSDGDGSFAGESYTLLLNEWYGANVYWVMDPEPVRLKLRYRASGDRVYPIEINASGYIFKPGFKVKEKPFLLVEVRTWFLTRILEDGVEKLAAVVDRNHNGRYDDKEDALFIDYNNNGFFTPDEAIIRKNGVKLKGARRTVRVDWGAYPGILQIKEGSR
jgi:hypothetical protein